MNAPISPKWQTGDRVLTPGGNLATILPKPWAMPLHTLVQIDDGAKLWILSELLKPADAAEVPVQPARRKGRSRK